MSEGLRTWGLRLLALGIAIALWFSISLEDREALSERIVEASVSYDRPRGFIVMNPEPGIRVRVRGASRQIRELNPYQVNVQVAIPQPASGEFTIILGPENVLVPEGLEVVSIDPNAIRVELEAETTRRVPVEPVFTGQTPAGTVVDEPLVFPSQVLLSGPESLIEQTETLRTIPISLNGHTLTYEVEVPMVQPDPLVQIVQPSRVTVRIPVRQSGNDEGPPADQEEEQP